MIQYIYAEVEAARRRRKTATTFPRAFLGTGSIVRPTPARPGRTNTQDTRPFYYSQVASIQNRDRVNRSRSLRMTAARPRAPRQRVHVDDFADLWIDPNDQGVSSSNDDGLSITFVSGNFIQTTNLPISQFYEMRTTTPFRATYAPALDNGAWCGPSRRKQGGTPNSVWYTISGGDGFYLTRWTRPDQHRYAVLVRSATRRG